MELRMANPAQMYASFAPMSASRYGVTKTTTNETTTFTAVFHASNVSSVFLAELEAEYLPTKPLSSLAVSASQSPQQ